MAVAVLIAPLNVLAALSLYEGPLHLIWFFAVPVSVAFVAVRKMWFRIFVAIMLSAWVFVIVVITNILAFGASV